MNTARRKNILRTTAFVFALLTACTGMAGTVSSVRFDGMMTVSAEDNTPTVTYQYFFEGSWSTKGGRFAGETQCLYESDKPDDWKTDSELCTLMNWMSCEGDLFYERVTDGIFVTGNEFSLNSGDNVVFYYVRTNNYGNLEEKRTASVSADEEIAIPNPADGQKIYAKRYVRKGTANGLKTTIDNFEYADGKWIYLEANDWKNTAVTEDSEILSITKSDFDLKPYTYQANGKASSLQIYSTALNNEGTRTLVGEINGNSDFDTLNLLVSSSKNTGYIAVRTQGGAWVDKYYGNVSMFRYDADKKSWETFYNQNANEQANPQFNTLTLFPKAKTFPMLADKDVQELRIYRTVDGEKTLVKTIDKKTFDGGYGAVDQKFDNDTMGFCIGNTYEEYSWEADYISEFASSHLQKTSDTTIEGKFLANIPYTTTIVSAAVEEEMTDYLSESFLQSLPAPYVFDDETTALPELPPPAYDEDGDGIEDSAQSRPVHFSEEFEEIEKGQHGNVYLIKGTKIIESYTAGDFDNGNFTIPDFEPYEDYFLKISHVADDGEGGSLNDYYTYYKWDEEAGKWRFRVNNEATPVVKVPVTHAEYIPFLSDYKIDFSLVTGGSSSSVISSISKADFDAGNASVTLMLLNAGEYQITFSQSESQSEKETGKKISGYATYQFVGIDPVFVDSEYTVEFPMTVGILPPVEHSIAEVLTNSSESDVISVDGTAADGNPVHYELTQNFSHDTIQLPEGDFTVSDTTSGYKAEVSVKKADDDTVKAVVTDESSVDSRYVNLSTPIEINDYTVSAPDGTVLEEGSMKDKQLSVSDLAISAGDLRSKAYANFYSESGIINAIDGGASIETEDGYLGVKNDEILKVVPDSKIKGDINADGEVTVTDAVLLQKYLHNKATYQIENFANADMNNDSKVNVFDMALLKKELLKK